MPTETYQVMNSIWCINEPSMSFWVVPSF